MFYNKYPKETYYEDDWWLMENRGFEIAMVRLYEETHGTSGWKEMRDYSKVPTKEVFELYKRWKGLPQGEDRRAFEAENPELDQWLHLTTGSMLETERAEKEAKRLKEYEESGKAAKWEARVRKAIDDAAKYFVSFEGFPQNWMDWTLAQVQEMEQLIRWAKAKRAVLG